jgi:wobble nucleotide-excising tRNase
VRELALIERIQLLRNVGQFDSVNANQLTLAKLTLIYAENGRGKTTLASILRSAGNGDAAIIAERRRLTTQNLPQIVIADNAGAVTFQNGAWSRAIPDIFVFDDMFVAENVCSGVELETEHRQNLHELILGARGVALNTAVQDHVATVEEHNKRLRGLTEAIPAASRGRLSVDAFCALAPRSNIADAIQEVERSLAAARSADAVRSRATFRPLQLPAFDVEAISTLLLRDLPGLETSAATRVQDHLTRLGEGGETWVADGMPRIEGASLDTSPDACPFCAQDLAGSQLITHYQAYFSEAYAELKSAIVKQGQSVSAIHGEDVPAAFERDVRVAAQTREFWAAFATVPDISIDTAEIARAWKAARDGVITALRAKHAAPLEQAVLPAVVCEAVDAFHRHRETVAQASAALQDANGTLELIKEQAASANVASLEADLGKLQAIKARHTPEVAAACQAYLDEKAAKGATEQLRDQARAALDQYRTTIFPTYETAINVYLRKFGAGFRLGNVESVNNRGGSSCTYNVLINDVPVSVTAASGPSFRNTLSAGDRNTLALAFFFASLEHDANLSRKIVVIDDPMTSLDEHRNRNTLHEMRQLLGRVDQMIVLSHSKPFLCPLWQDATPTMRTAIRIDRVRTGQNQDASTMTAWNVHHDCVSDHDHRHELVRTYLQSADPAQERSVATALRPILEAFMRIAYPAAFPPGTLLGPFIGICDQRCGTHRQILAAPDIQELRSILDYANEFHHDTNPAYQTVLINGQELTHFCERTLAFASRP